MPMERVVVACGPEGGFTDEEVAFARERGFVAVRLGGRILRCETAALAALSIIQFEWGDL
jgi:16S rRNA (uracil1498-N3)-methyltransferase